MFFHDGYTTLVGFMNREPKLEAVSTKVDPVPAQAAKPLSSK